jgi:hypothetical protein
MHSTRRAPASSFFDARDLPACRVVLVAVGYLGNGALSK